MVQCLNSWPVGNDQVSCPVQGRGVDLSEPVPLNNLTSSGTLGQGTERIGMAIRPALVQTPHPSVGSLESRSNERNEMSSRKAQAGTPMSVEPWKVRGTGEQAWGVF